MNLTGKIIHGEGRGAQIGFPTLNIEGVFPNLQQGVYAVWVTLGAARYKGAMNYGAQPTFNSKQVRIEIFLLDFEGDVYGETAQVEVASKIRDIKKFANAEELKAQIAKDVLEVSLRADVYK